MGKGSKISPRSQLKKCSNRGYSLEDRIAQLPEDQIAQLPEDWIVHVPEDRISQLPDDILILILSFLKLKEAAQTSVLSRRWPTLWVYNPRLEFDAPKALQRTIQNFMVGKKERHNFVNWVNSIMQLHKGSTVDEFRLCFSLDKFSISQNDIAKWLDYSFKRKVQRLELDLLKPYSSVSCDFPDRLLNTDIGLSTGLSHLNYCDSQLPGSIHFKPLRELILRCVNITGEAIEFFLHNCPFLEQLVVVESEKLGNLIVSGPSLMLKHLQIELCPNVESIKICDSNIVSLNISVVENLILTNVPKLTKLSVLEWGLVDWSHVFSQLSCCLSQLEKFTLHTQPKALAEVSDFPELSQLKHLKIGADAFYDDSLMVFTSLIKACPYLQKFVLQLRWICPSKIKRRKEKGAVCSLKYLRVIEFIGYWGRVSDIELLEFFLENAVALEEITIDCREHEGRRPIKGLEPTARTCSLKEIKQLVPKHVKLVIL
ncbi:hypothetical protein ACH5RR_034570 [Cinchona calisaya]|uniref:F-box domain-containing protein n=1 Tax=Cinchona calisaya TaxID=153742 RepID=A0ABD2YF73_9GENT